MLDKKGNVIIYPAEKLYPYGLRKLGVKAYSAHELATKMSRLQPDKAIVDSVIQRLRDNQYLNDISVVRITYNIYKNKEGIAKIKNRLAQKGISREDIESGLQECMENIVNAQEDAIENAFHLLQKKFKMFDSELYQKYMRFLMSKQFSQDVIRKALSQFKLHQN